MGVKVKVEKRSKQYSDRLVWHYNGERVVKWVSVIPILVVALMRGWGCGEASEGGREVGEGGRGLSMSEGIV